MKTRALAMIVCVMKVINAALADAMCGLTKKGKFLRKGQKMKPLTIATILLAFALTMTPSVFAEPIDFDNLNVATATYGNAAGEQSPRLLSAYKNKIYFVVRRDGTPTPSKVYCYDPLDGLSDGANHSVLKGTSGEFVTLRQIDSLLYFSDNLGHVYSYDGTVVTELLGTPFAAGDYVSSIEKFNGLLYFGTSTGNIFRYDGLTFEPVREIGEDRYIIDMVAWQKDGYLYVSVGPREYGCCPPLGYAIRSDSGNVDSWETVFSGFWAVSLFMPTTDHLYSAVIDTAYCHCSSIRKSTVGTTFPVIYPSDGQYKRAWGAFFHDGIAYFFTDDSCYGFGQIILDDSGSVSRIVNQNWEILHAVELNGEVYALASSRSGEQEGDIYLITTGETETQFFFDDFNGTVLDTSQWSVFVDALGQYHWPYVAGGFLYSQGYHTRIDSIPTFAPAEQSVIARARIRLAGAIQKFGFAPNPNERPGPITGYYFDTLHLVDEGGEGREGYIHALAWYQPELGPCINLLDVEVPVTWYEFHEFAIERTPSEVIYSIDGQEVARVEDAFADALPVGVWNDRWGMMQTDWVEVSYVGEPKWSFVQITDPHIGYFCGMGPTEERLAAAIDEINNMAQEPDFLLVTGDIVEYSWHVKTDLGWELFRPMPYFEWFLDTLESLNSGIDVYVVPGNHDRYAYKHILQCVDPGLPLSLDLSLYNAYFELPEDANVLPGLTQDYSFEHKGLTFIGLDSGEDLNTLRSDFRGTGLTDDQMVALEGLDPTSSKVIFMHHPTVDSNDWAIVQNRERFIDYCSDNGVQLVVAGHTHEDHIVELNDVQYVQTPSVGKDNHDAGFKHGYRIIDVRSGDLHPQEYTETGTIAGRVKKMIASLFCPATLHVYDSLGRHVGINGVGGVEREIARAFYLGRQSVVNDDGSTTDLLPEKIIIFDPCDDHFCRIVGAEMGTYRLEMSFGEDGNETVFEANDIPILDGAVHDYIMNWDALADGQAGATVSIDREGDGDFEKTVVSGSVLTADEFDTPSVIEIIVPEAGDAVQDGITFTAAVTDIDGVNAVYFYVREPNMGGRGRGGGRDGISRGTPIGQENLPAAFNSVTDKWEYRFDSTQVQDGYYWVLAKAVDSYGNEGWSEVVSFSIRNWAVVNLLPASESSNSGRTMPIKFSLRVAEAADPAMPFVYNEGLAIVIYDADDRSTSLQTSRFGNTATDYRIDGTAELYITNFKTDKKPTGYTVEIWRPGKWGCLVGSFTFSTTR